MSVKIYFKVGKKNYKEVKLVNALQKAITEKIQQNPEFEKEFQPAKNFDELQKLYDKYVVTDVEFTEIKDNAKENIITEEEIKKDSYEEHKKFRESMEDTTKNEDDIIKSQLPKKDDIIVNDDADFVDPFNREEPIVRDYVINNDLPTDGEISNAGGSGKTSFEEPLTFRDAFEIPSDDETSAPRISGAVPNNSERNTNNNQQAQKPKQPRAQQEPFNPNFDDMSNAKKRKSTKKFAKYIVETVCMLSEKGFVWYANKDINEAKLAEYELNNEMDLDLFVTLEDGQQATVKQFFQIQCLKAEQLAKIDPEEKADLADALAEVLLEKGVGPTPIQELLLISVKIFGGQVVNLIALKSQTNSLLNQLRQMKQQQLENDMGQNYYTPPSTQPAPPPPAQQTPPPAQKPKQQKVNKTEEEIIKEQLPLGEQVVEDFDSMVQEEEEEVKKIMEENKIIDEPIETKE
jgi:hypothetical protein